MTLRSWAKQEEQYKQDYLSTLPEEILLKIVGYLLPNVGPVHLRAHLLNYKGMQFDPSIGVMVQRPVPLTGLEINSTNIASVSKRFSKLVSEVLYRDRWFQVRFGSSVKVEQVRIIYSFPRHC